MMLPINRNCVPNDSWIWKKKLYDWIEHPYCKYCNSIFFPFFLVFMYFMFRFDAFEWCSSSVKMHTNSRKLVHILKCWNLKWFSFQFHEIHVFWFACSLSINLYTKNATCHRISIIHFYFFFFVSCPHFVRKSQSIWSICSFHFTTWCNI